MPNKVDCSSERLKLNLPPPPSSSPDPQACTSSSAVKVSCPATAPPSCRRSSRVSTRLQSIYWNGLLSWVSDCPKCPLLFFDADFAGLASEPRVEEEEETTSCATVSDLSSTDPTESQAEARKRLLHQARDLIERHHLVDALSRLLKLTSMVAYKVTEEECALLIHVAEIVIRNRLQGARVITHKDLSHAIGFVKANIRRTSATSLKATEEEVNIEKEEFRNLLLTMSDVCQSIRYQMTHECFSGGTSESLSTDQSSSGAKSEELPPTQAEIVHNERFNHYLTFFSLLLQSAFLEGGFVCGNVYINRLVGNAEEAYHSIHECDDERVLFLRPLAAYIYGRLWCETGDESQGAYFLSQYYEKYGVEFEKMLIRDGAQQHSTYMCNMRRIRQTVHKYQHLL